MRNLACKTLLIALTMSVSPTSFACDISGRTGIVAENTLFIPVGLKAMGGINELTFNKVIDRVVKYYAPVVAKKGAKLSVVKKWTDGTVNAYAHRDPNGKTWFVSMFGGLARHPEITEDAFATVVCHELGHQIGGAPKKLDPNAGSTWASNEGQADYFASLKCLRKYFSTDRNTEYIKKLKVPADVKLKCTANYANPEEAAVCIRSTVAGIALGNFFRVLSNGKVALSISTPDKKVVTKTFDSHPDSQCRVDSYYQGAMCDVPVSVDVSDKDENIGTCSNRNGSLIGSRPLCWFKPSV